tara:strand:+ start:8392 stop:8994 length:603 start_codon:yes stop_codon:yes gene_type:complete
MTQVDKYRFSFTASSLRTRAFVTVVQYLDGKRDEDIELTLGKGKRSTGKRMFEEMLKWSECLTSVQKQALLNGNFKTQNEIAFVAACKYYRFIRDFVLEVVREKYLVYDYEITLGDYLSFFRRKAEEHQEMYELSEITQNKVRQVTFKILEQAGLINNVRSKLIQPQMIEPETRNTILYDNPDLFKIFLFSDFDIENMKA